jgi:hypothetical protein
MTVGAFDTLKCARRLIEAGYTDVQAEVQAEIMAEAFVYNISSLVSTDYLDARLAEQEARIDTRFAEQDAKLGARFAEQDAKFEARFTEQDTKFEARFTEQDAKFEARFTEQDVKFDTRFSAVDLKLADISGQFRLIYWMLAVVIASTVIPAIQQLASA